MSQARYSILRNEIFFMLLVTERFAYEYLVKNYLIIIIIYRVHPYHAYSSAYNIYKHYTCSIKKRLFCLVALVTRSKA